MGEDEEDEEDLFQGVGSRCLSMAFTYIFTYSYIFLHAKIVCGKESLALPLPNGHSACSEHMFSMHALCRRRRRGFRGSFSL